VSECCSCNTVTGALTFDLHVTIYNIYVYIMYVVHTLINMKEYISINNNKKHIGCSHVVIQCTRQHKKKKEATKYKITIFLFIVHTP
jgi:hypothetical protein